MIASQITDILYGLYSGLIIQTTVHNRNTCIYGLCVSQHINLSYERNHLFWSHSSGSTCQHLQWHWSCKVVTSAFRLQPQYVGFDFGDSYWWKGTVASLEDYWPDPVSTRLCSCFPPGKCRALFSVCTVDLQRFLYQMCLSKTIPHPKTFSWWYH